MSYDLITVRDNVIRGLRVPRRHEALRHCLHYDPITPASLVYFAIEALRAAMGIN